MNYNGESCVRLGDRLDRGRRIDAELCPLVGVGSSPGSRCAYICVRASRCDVDVGRLPIAGRDNR
jgi:hypothetical protein